MHLRLALMDLLLLLALPLLLLQPARLLRALCPPLHEQEAGADREGHHQQDVEEVRMDPLYNYVLGPNPYRACSASPDCGLIVP